MSDAFKESNTHLFKNLVTFTTGFGVIADEPFIIGSISTNNSNLIAHNQIIPLGGISGYASSGNLSDTYLTITGGTQSVIGEKTFQNNITFESLVQGVGGGHIDFTEGSSFLRDNLSLLSVTWADRRLWNAAETIVLDWETKQLSGNWVTSGLTTLGRIAPFGGISGYLSSGDRSQLVTITGVQLVTGKNFRGQITAPALYGDDSNPNIGINLSNGEVYDADGIVGINISTRRMSDNGDLISVDWQNRILSGDWNVERLKISGHSVSTGGSVVGGSNIQNAITGSGNLGYIPRFVNQSGITSSSIYNNSLGNIGINNPNPQNLLDISGGSGQIVQRYTLDGTRYVTLSNNGKTESANLPRTETLLNISSPNLFSAGQIQRVFTINASGSVVGAAPYLFAVQLNQADIFNVKSDGSLFLTGDQMLIEGRYGSRNAQNNLFTYFGQTGTNSSNVGGIYVASITNSNQVLGYSATASNIFFPHGNVGIHTSTPISNMDISGHMKARNITGEVISASSRLTISGQSAITGIILQSGYIPTAYNSPGFIGQTALSGTYLHICTGANAWGTLVIGPYQIPT